MLRRPECYDDQNGDGRLSTFDASRVLNGLALIQGDEGEAVLMRSWQPKPKPSNSFQDTVTEVRKSGVDSEQFTTFEVTAVDVTVFDITFKAVDAAFETCLLASESHNAIGLDRQQTLDSVMVYLLHEKTWLQQS